MSTKVEGVWRADDLLVVSRRHATFPNRCIWTNAPVDGGLTSLRVQYYPSLGWRIRFWRGLYLARGALSSCELSVPVSREWKGARDATLDYVGRVVLAVGLACWLPMLALILVVLIFRPPPGEPLFTGLSLAAGIPGGIAVVATTVGLAWRYVELPFSPDQPVMATLLNGDHVFLAGVDPRFLADLPPWEGAPLPALLPSRRTLLAAFAFDGVHLLLWLGLIVCVALSKSLVTQWIK